MTTTTMHNAVDTKSTSVTDHSVQIGSPRACGFVLAPTEIKTPAAGCGMPQDDELLGSDAKRELSGLEDGLTAVLQNDLTVLPGVDLARFAQWVLVLQRGQQAWLQQLAEPDTLDRLDIFRWIIEAKTAGDLDEALWRGFLATHFGRGSADPAKRLQVESAAQLLCGFGDSPRWTWDAVSSQPEVFEDWLEDEIDQLQNVIQFGNHRKRRSKQPGDIFRVVESFVEWVDRHGKTPQRAFTTIGARTPEERFDVLYYRALELYDFGRLAALDMLILLGEVGVLAIRPGSVYLKGATGPLAGARKLWGNLPVAKLAWRADELARRADLPFDIVEDALCMWQK